jgi:flagellar biogenesis protein FliO
MKEDSASYRAGVTMTDANKTAKLGTWTPWVAIALVATIAGVMLPQMLPGENALSRMQVKADASEKPKAYTAPSMPEAPDFQGMLLRLGGGTAVVIGLCVSTLWGLRRWMNPLQATGMNAREMQLKETLNLGNRCALHLVHLGKREVLVGVDSAGIKVIVPLAGAFEDVLAQTGTPDDEVIPPPRLAA